MRRPMEGVRIEVAQFTFVRRRRGARRLGRRRHQGRARGDRGRPARADRARSAGRRGRRSAPIIEHPNRGKRSVGLALEHPRRSSVLDELVRSSDVFLTNFLPDARARLRIDVDDVRAVNPDIVYVRGSGFGHRGREPTGRLRRHRVLGARRQRRRCDARPTTTAVLGMPAPARTATRSAA